MQARLLKPDDAKAERVQHSRMSEDQGSECSSNAMSTGSACTQALHQNEAILQHRNSGSSNDDFAAVCLDPGNARQRGYITAKQLRDSLKRLHQVTVADEHEAVQAQSMK